MGSAARKLDALTPETADPASVVDLADYKHRRALSACRLASGRSLLAYESASEHGLYRYTAFGKTVEDTTTITQPLRWKGRWFSSVAGGIYDVRARQWAPEIGVFLAVDEFEFQDVTGTLWSWPMQSPVAFPDPSGHYPAPAPPVNPPTPPPPPPPPCMSSDELNRCLDHAGDDPSGWWSYCGTLHWSKRRSCRSHSFSSPQERSNWCFWHFGGD